MRTNEKEEQVPILSTFINHYHYLRNDADFLLSLAQKEGLSSSFNRIQLCRTSLLLYILAMEALINRALAAFLPEEFKRFFLDREKNFNFLDKWEMLPMLVSKGSVSKFDKTKYPWSHFKELVSIRNDFVHPSPKRVGFYAMINNETLDFLPWNKIPQGLKYKNILGEEKEVKESLIIYRQTLIPKDPYGIMPEHVKKVREVVDDTIRELDKLLEGRITDDNWLRNDQMTIIHPPGATFGKVHPEK